MNTIDWFRKDFILQASDIVVFEIKENRNTIVTINKFKEEK